MRSKLFPQFVKKIEKLKLSWSKQHNKMLKMRSKMLKIKKKKKWHNNQARKSFHGISRITGIPRIFRTSRISRDSRGIFENFSFRGKLKIRGKGKP